MFYEVNRMKVFISWSGDLSKKIAESLKKWIPGIIQTVDVFFSPEDIEKGENWDSKISKELTESKYGIICLTKDNVSASWVHFEAGAIAKALDSRVATLMVNINPSDIKGPLSRYQATKIEKDDFFHLLESINKQSEAPLDLEVLRNLFNGLWGPIEVELQSIISQHTPSASEKGKKGDVSGDAIEEILQLLRKQHSILSSPENLIPVDYFDFLVKNTRRNETNGQSVDLIRELLNYLSWLMSSAESSSRNNILPLDVLSPLFDIIIVRTRAYPNRALYRRTRELHETYLKMIYSSSNTLELSDDRDSPYD